MTFVLLWAPSFQHNQWSRMQLYYGVMLYINCFLKRKWDYSFETKGILFLHGNGHSYFVASRVKNIESWRKDSFLFFGRTLSLVVEGCNGETWCTSLFQQLGLQDYLNKVILVLFNNVYTIGTSVIFIQHNWLILKIALLLFSFPILNICSLII